jgi:hypothetical protein
MFTKGYWNLVKMANKSGFSRKFIWNRFFDN